MTYTGGFTESFSVGDSASRYTFDLKIVWIGDNFEILEVLLYLGKLQQSNVVVIEYCFICN